MISRGGSTAGKGSACTRCERDLGLKRNRMGLVDSEE